MANITHYGQFFWDKVECRNFTHKKFLLEFGQKNKLLGGIDWITKLPAKIGEKPKSVKELIGNESYF